MKLVDYRGRGIANTMIAEITLKLSGEPEQRIMWNGICFADMFRRYPFEGLQGRYTPSGNARKIKSVRKYVHFIHTSKSNEWLTDDLLDRYLAICINEMPDYIQRHIKVEYISHKDFEEMFPPPDDPKWVNAGWEAKKTPGSYGIGRRAITITDFGKISGSELFYILNLFRVPTEHPVVVGGTVCIHNQVKNEPWFRLVHPSFIHLLTAYLYAVPSGHKIWRQTSLRQDWYSVIDTWNPWEQLWKKHIEGGTYKTYVESHSKMYDMEGHLMCGDAEALICKRQKWDPAESWDIFQKTIKGEVVKVDLMYYDHETPNGAFSNNTKVLREIILD